MEAKKKNKKKKNKNKNKKGRKTKRKKERKKTENGRKEKPIHNCSQDQSSQNPCQSELLSDQLSNSP